MRNCFRTILREVSRSCQTLSRTKELHALIVTTHLARDPFYVTKLVTFYSISGDLPSARGLFDRIPHRSVFLWNSIIRAYARGHRFDSALALFSRMLGSDTRADSFTYACLIRAFSENFDSYGLRFVHGTVIASGFGPDCICGSALVTAYSKLGLVDEASKVFRGIPNPDSVLWNCMISSLGYRGFWDKGIQLFNMMRHAGARPDGYTIVGLISGLTDRKLLRVSECVHGFSLKVGLCSNAFVGSALVSMYSRLRCMSYAHSVFSGLFQPDLVTWSALISGYSLCGDDKQALILFKKLSTKGVPADAVIVSGVLTSCARLVNLKVGREIHGFLIQQGLESNTMVSSALTDMYSKCGFMGSALRVFDGIPEKNVISFNSVILGLGLHGSASRALGMFSEMLDTGLKPDESTFSGLLCSCYHAGLVREGREIFTRMKDDFHIEPRPEHCVYMVKLLGMAGELEKAYEFIRSLPTPVGSGAWGALLSSSHFYGDSKMAELVAQRLFESEPEKFAYRVMLSNVYSVNGSWEKAEFLRGAIPGRAVKVPGISWI